MLFKNKLKFLNPLEIAILVLFAVVGVFVIVPAVQNMRLKTNESSAGAVLADIRKGIKEYYSQSKATERIPMLPEHLDTAHKGPASEENKFFTFVLSKPVTIGWMKSNDSYLDPNKEVFTYDKNTGSFYSIASLMISCWPMDEGSGRIVEGRLGIYRGRIRGNATWAAGKIDDTLQFDGQGSHVHIEDSLRLDLSNCGTIQAWVFCDEFKPYAGIVHKGEAKDFSDEAYSLQFAEDNRLMLVLVDRQGKDHTLKSISDIEDRKWYLVTATWDETGMKLYLNGKLDAVASDEVVTARGTRGGLNIGAQLEDNYSDDELNFPFHGRIDQVELYNDALSEDQIYLSYEAYN